MVSAPLVITADPGVRVAVDRIAAAAGIVVERATAVGSGGAWRRAPLVLLDAALLPDVVAARLPRREGVVVLAVRELDAEQWQCCLAVGVQRVCVVGASDEQLVGVLGDATDPAERGPGGGRVIAVVGACGGAGATVLAAATAVAAHRSGRGTLLADADPWGPGVEVLLGLEDAGGARWADIAAPSGRLAAEALHRALPSLRLGQGRLSVLGHGREAADAVDPSLLDTVLQAAQRAGDVCVVDVPHAPTAAADRAVSRADLTVLVVPADVRGCYGAARLTGRLGELGARLGLVVRGPSPGGLGADDVASALRLPLVAAMRPEPGLDRRLDSGGPPGINPRGPLGRAAVAVLAGAEPAG